MIFVVADMGITSVNQIQTESIAYYKKNSHAHLVFAKSAVSSRDTTREYPEKMTTNPIFS